MTKPMNRRFFLQTSMASALAAPLGASWEEQDLLAQGANPVPSTASQSDSGEMPVGTIGKVKISRLICGGNLISGFAHSRDLIYVSPLLKHYFTDEKVMETWALCERHGINTMINSPSDLHAMRVYREYLKRGGRMQYLAQLVPEKDNLELEVRRARDQGAVGAFLIGNYGDEWTRDGSVDLIGVLVEMIRAQGMIAGVGGHELRTPLTVEKHGIAPDFYMKTLHSNQYWSKRQAGQNKEVIDNYSVDNYWCMDPEETIAYMRSLKRPWLAYKVLAAGAIHPREGFRFAFEKGADFAVVGMFDFQIAENASILRKVLSGPLSRSRAWQA
jgi:hypothetical protein